VRDETRRYGTNHQLLSIRQRASSWMRNASTCPQPLDLLVGAVMNPAGVRQTCCPCRYPVLFFLVLFPCNKEVHRPNIACCKKSRSIPNITDCTSSIVWRSRFCRACAGRKKGNPRAVGSCANQSYSLCRTQMTNLSLMITWQCVSFAFARMITHRQQVGANNDDVSRLRQWLQGARVTSKCVSAR